MNDNFNTEFSEARQTISWPVWFLTYVRVNECNETGQVTLAIVDQLLDLEVEGQGSSVAGAQMAYHLHLSRAYAAMNDDVFRSLCIYVSVNSLKQNDHSLSNYLDLVALWIYTWGKM